MTAIHGGTATNDRIEAQHIAVLLRGGLLPQTHRPYPLPALGKQLASKANCDGGAERCAAPAGPKSSAGALALLGPDAQRRRAVELSILPTAKQHDVPTRALRRTVPGSGELRRLVLRYDSHNIHRVPRVQDCVSYCRLVTGAQDSAGQRSDTAGPTMGNAFRQWACSEAAVLVVRANPAGSKSLARLKQNHGTGKAWTVLAHPGARAGYDLLPRGGACDRNTFFPGSGSGAGAPAASLMLNVPTISRKRRGHYLSVNENERAPIVGCIVLLASLLAIRPF